MSDGHRYQRGYSLTNTDGKPVVLNRLVIPTDPTRIARTHARYLILVLSCVIANTSIVYGDYVMR